MLLASLSVSDLNLQLQYSIYEPLLQQVESSTRTIPCLVQDTLYVPLSKFIYLTRTNIYTKLNRLYMEETGLAVVTRFVAEGHLERAAPKGAKADLGIGKK